MSQNFNDTKLVLSIALVLIILVVSYNFSYFKPREFVDVTSKNYLEGDNWDKQIKRSIFDYLPIYAKMPPVELATRNYSIISGDVKIENFSEGTNWFRFNAVSKEQSVMQISQYYFPGWKVYVNGKLIPVWYNNDLGLITINLEKGVNKVNGKLINTPVRLVSNLLSLFSIIGVLYFLRRKE